MVSVDTTATIVSATLWMESYDIVLDSLSMLGDSYKAGFSAKVADGRIVMTALTTSDAKSWKEAFKWMAYKLNVEVR